MKLFKLSVIVLIILLFALPVLAQSEDATIPPATYALPPILLGLMALNNRSTEALKLWLVSQNLPYTPPESIRSLLVLVFSIGFGIASAYVTPNSTEWLGDSFAVYPVAGFVVTGFVVSLGAGAAQIVLGLLNGLGNKSVYSTTTTISTPSPDVSNPAYVEASFSPSYTTITKDTPATGNENAKG